MKVKSIFALVALFLLIQPCWCLAPLLRPPPTLPSPSPTAAPIAPSTPTMAITPVPPPPNARGPAFAIYRPVPVSLPQVYQGYTLPVDLGTVRNPGNFSLNPRQNALLAQNGFVVVPAPWLEFFQVYQQNRYHIPSFVTTDAVYHIYHLVFGKMLRDLERESFAPDIAALTRACRETAQSLYYRLQGTSLESAARRVWAYFSVADALIHPDAAVPAEVADWVSEELDRIHGHSGEDVSPIFGYREDYSQYEPRGHYTRSEQLQRYFRAMMWYGRMQMRLQSPDETRMALLITYILRHTTVNGEPAASLWARVYEPTTFIVGKADDLSFHEYNALWDAVFGPSAGPESIADERQLQSFIQSARLLPPPQIAQGEGTQNFRLMGQRFTLDAYIFSQLVEPRVEGRLLPRGLDVMAALGSDEAYAILDSMGETAYSGYGEQMAKVREEIRSLPPESWTQTLYWAWLYALQPLLEPRGESYPAFMRTRAWTRKDLHTALASWTELKHDTILYAKQLGLGLGGEEPEQIPQGWVEPNPEAYARLLALTRMTADGLSSRGLLSENIAQQLSRLEDMLSFLLDVSLRELNGQPLSPGDYERIDHIGQWMEEMTLATADREEGEEWADFLEEHQAALVADVATSNGTVLEEAIGYVFEIYVIVPDARGRLQIARGGVFSYYEFPWQASDRLTDEAWREMLASGRAPERPLWTAEFVAP